MHFLNEMGFCEHGNEIPSSTKSAEFRDLLNDYHFQVCLCSMGLVIKLIRLCLYQ